ncbi:MAG: hypothetical protein H6907_03245 [Hyphomicrobiales bacterium]|nr:hypothetical protein [Hyphomicrobiales bacterium]MCP5370723.1 hypothetical protein [Hyphomicrobiales bacterium]
MKTLKTALVAAALVTAAALPARAGTIENLERERAILLETLLAADMVPQDRNTKVAVSKGRLIDLERMVIRDKSLAGRNTPHVRAAFESYDLTFLVHAATEKNLTLLDHWLEEVGVSTQSLMNARVGRR